MPLYKFYRIVPKDTTQTDCYIGHTIQPLRKRFTAHCLKSNDTTSKALFERYGKEGLEIILIHELELPDKEYARREERRLWEEVKEHAVNHRKPWRSEEEKKTHQKQYEEENREARAILLKRWYEEHKEVVLTRQKQWREANKEQYKQWREANKEQLKQQNKQWREANKEQLKQKNKQWREENKEQLKQRRKAKKATPPPDASSDTPQTQPLE
jgi:hypothetical protein